MALFVLKLMIFKICLNFWENVQGVDTVLVALSEVFRFRKDLQFAKVSLETIPNPKQRPNLAIHTKKN